MIIELGQTAKRYGKFTAVDDVSIRIEKGEVVGFVGANGAGKTTTINMMLGFTSPSQGKVKLFGETVLPRTAHRQHQRIGYASSDMQLPLRLTGRQYLEFIRHRSGKDIAKRLEQLQARFKPELDKKISTLSRGNKQKIALIGAFVTEPKLVILDEPTSGLDPVMQGQFLQLVRDEQLRGTTIFMSSHYLGEVVEVCSRVILMRQGQIVSDTPTKQLLAQSGKKVRVVMTGSAKKPPKEAEAISLTKLSKTNRQVEFIWRGEATSLQQWLAAVTGLVDLEVSEVGAETAFLGMYEDEPEAKP